MTPDEVPAWLRRRTDLVRPAITDAGTAMGQRFQRDVVQSMRGSSPSPPGTPPARVTGTLARSVRATKPEVSGYTARVSVAPHTVYARIQQKGGHIVPVRAKFLRFSTPRGKWAGGVLVGPRGVQYSKHVYLPPRPYMDVTPQRAAAAFRAGRDAFFKTMGW